MRLIDADVLKKELAKNITIWTFNISYDGILAEIIDNAPTVETRKIEHKAYNEGFKDGTSQGIKLSERPQGKWIATKYFNWVCSECGKNPTIGMGYVQNHTELFNFCPNCGVKMKKGGAEE